jgi:4-hydroxy-3-methylbut-2-enyl diphosphate reductase
VLLVENIADVHRMADEATAEFLAKPLAFVTQTTLSVDDTQGIVETLRRRFPAIVGPHKEDICYATTNRQEAVKQIASSVDALLVVGSANSSNSQRLKEVSERAGCKNSQLVLRASDIDWAPLGDIRKIGITAGASAPEVLVEEIIDAFAERYTIEVETVATVTETMFFPLPRELRAMTEPAAVSVVH